MSRKRKIMIVCIAAALLVMAGAGAYAATNYGSTSDPLITKSYLDQVLTPNLNNQFRTELNTAVKGLESSSGTGSGNGALCNALPHPRNRRRCGKEA